MSNCKDAVNRLYEYLDRELTDAELSEVHRHLEHCPPCLDLFRFEENVLTLVGKRCRETIAPPSLRDKVQKLCQHD
jgi:mycothiol system anti-sigma-R factor